MAKKNEPIERLVIKLPRSVAEYFRTTFTHGKRSEFVKEKILEYKHKQDIAVMEDELRKMGKKRK